MVELEGVFTVMILSLFAFMLFYVLLLLTLLGGVLLLDLIHKTFNKDNYNKKEEDF